MRKALLATVLSFFLMIGSVSTAQGTDRKLPEWGAACPQVVDASPNLDQPKIEKFVFNGHIFTRLVDGGTNAVTSPASLVGCYVDLSAIAGTNPEWQIGAINRDAAGFYWINSAKVAWRLSLADDGLMTDRSNPYFGTSNKFEFVQASTKITNCKLKDVYQGGVRIGFDRNSQRVRSLGESKNLIVVIDFSDLPYTDEPQKLVDTVLSPDIVSNFYKANSYGRLNLKFQTYGKTVRAGNPSTFYLPDAKGSFFVNGMWQDQRLTQEIVRSIQSSVDVMSFDSFSILVSGGAGMGGYYGAAVPGNQIILPNGVLRNTSVMGVGIGTASSPVPSWKVFAHEMGHLLGFIDLYIPGVEASGKSPGPFDLMGNTSGSANDFFAWHRWTQGWIDDDSVECDLNFPSNKQVTLNSITSSSGKRLFVAPLSSTKLLAIEYRRDSSNDRLSGEDGLLAYVIDLEVQGLKGTVSIQSSYGDQPNSYRTDRELYAKATITPEQVLYFENVVIRNLSQDADSARFVIESKDEYAKFVEAEAAKAKAIIDAKAAADAKIAAELKVVTDAKAAADLKAQLALQAKKKITITCLKGKVVKKISAVGAKCPSGYKKR